MSDVVNRLDGLSPERQALVREILRRKLVREQEEDVVRPRGDEGPAPLSFAQQRLWLVDRLEPGSASYNLPFALRLGGALDVDALARALAEVVRRHASLRTVFAEAGDEPVQVIAPAAFVLPVDDLSGLDGDACEAEVRRRAGEDAARPFDLAAGPLFRAALLRLGDDEHVLLLCMHHIVGDGWSLGVLFRELGTLYAAFRDGGPSPLPELPVQYADYAVWQRQRLQGQTLERELAYWRARLEGAPALLELPTEHPRPPARTYRGAHVPVRVPAEVAARLQALGREEDATPFMVLLAAFQLVLSKYAGRDDVVVGSPVAGRTRAEVEGLIGFFINTLVLRTDLSGDPSFRALLRRVREGTLGAYEHQQVPFEKLVAELQPERSLGHAPLFQVSFVLQNNERGDGGMLPGLRVRPVETATETAKFDLSLTLTETPRGLGGALEYSTDLFERATAERMVEHLGRVLEQVAADADVRLSAVELLSADERARIVDGWNETARPYPRGVCIHDRFAAQVRARPDAEALAWGDLRLSYAALDARSNRLAHHLVRRGVGPEARVGVLLERGPELIVSLLAILKAGGCYVPLDPTYPAGRLELMLADAGVRVLVSRSELAAALSIDGVGVVRLDEAADAIAAESPGPVGVAVSPDNLAYIVYTSGSTGKPKGVMVAHRHVVQLVVETDYVSLGPGDRVAQASNASFDALTFEAWGAFLNGAALVGIPREVLLSPPAMRAFLRDERITTLYQTTALLNQLTREQPDVFATLREVLFGGQASDADRVRALLRSGKPQRLLHMYGPTETTAWCSWEDVRHVPDDALTVTAGGPTGNQRIYLLDAALRPTPVGVPGEAYVGGDGVVRGYLDRPALTAERFLPDPFSPVPGARMYRTGDRLRWREVRACESANVRESHEDGSRGDASTLARSHARTFALEFVGRIDEQVKIRGFRIEPGEVESALSAHPEVREARVIVREDQPGEKRLVAYVVGDADGETLRASLRRNLPEYMVPAAVIVLERLPLTPNGKLDVKSLPAPELESGEERYVAPRTPLEEVLAEVWAEVLRVDRVGVHDGFFELGGHSLLATRVVSRIREVLGAELPLRALFEGPTVAELAERVEDIRRAGVPQLPPIVPVGREGALPLSFSQERLWFLDRMEPGSAFYNIPVALRLSGALDVDALERALGEIVRRHEALRTVFAEANGQPVQVIAPFTGFTLPVEDLSTLDADTREAAVRDRAGEEAARPFDLSVGPLFRASLLRLADDEHVLLLSMHHVVSDGWSMGLLFRELGALYAAYRDGRDSPLAELPVQYADYAAWQREHLQGEALDRELGWWKDRLAGAPALLELPTDHPRPAEQRYRGSAESIALPAALSERLRALGRTEGATLFMVLLGAWQVLLSKYAGSNDIVVGSPIAGRTRAEVEGLIGFFVNTLVLRTDLSGDPSFREVLGRVREGTLGAYEHQQVPFEKLVAELQPERSLSHAPLFQVSFALQNTEKGQGGGLPGLKMGPVGAEGTTAKFDLTLALTESPRGIGGALEYSTDLFERATIERMIGHLTRVLEQVADDADTRLSAVNLLSADERALVLDDWNRTEAEYPRESSVHALFEAQAERAPGATAVVFAGGALTYAELNARANRLAHHLRALGVGSESRVALVMPRSPELVAAELAVLKAGGVYVPLDPEHPAERLREVLADSAPAALLTTRALADHFADVSMPVVVLDDDAPAWASRPVTNPALDGVAAGQLAYVMYTSGSTGRPKGVMVPHRAIVRLVVNNGYAAFGAEDRVAFAANPAFDATTMEVWAPLVNGGALVIIDQDTLLDPARFATALCEHQVSVLWLTVGLFNQYADALQDEWGRLRYLIVGGDALDPRVISRVLSHNPPAHLLNGYGPTETTTFAVTHEIRHVEDGARSIPLGRPIGNTRVYILDRAGQPVPIGVAGELCIGGDGVARGYQARPEQTAERFIPDTFSAEPGARMYRTGDLARWKADGTIEFLGRTDHQVKVRGFRIELGEIEARLVEHAGVREAVVLVREDVPGEKRLVAYVTGDESVGADVLRAYLGDRLPSYMVPAAYVSLEQLPLTPNGKVDRRALPAPDYAGAEDEYVPPRNPLEEVVAEVWAEVLRVDRVGAHDGFFELGGHSLLATRVVSRIREVLGAELPLRALFEGPTVAELAERVEDIRRAGVPQLPPIVPVGREGALPLSFSQERLWFLDRMEPGSAFYNIPVALRLSGALNADALERALGEIVRRHEALRTVFAEANAQPVQVIAPFTGFMLPVEDLSTLDADTREAAVRDRAGEEAARPFDLSAGPLFRASLLRLGDDEHVLLLSMHHVVSDGWSMGLLFRELGALYAAYLEGRDSPLAELPVQYADYAAWQRDHLQGEALDRELSWWRERLSGAPALLELPTDHPRPAEQRYRGSAESIALPVAVSERLRALGRAEGATLFMVLLGAWQVLLSKYAGSNDIVVGSPIAGRTRAEVEGLIGFFVNTLVLRTDLSGDPSFREVLGRVREGTLGAYEHQHVPFEKLVAELQPERSLSHAPLFQVSFALQNTEKGQGGGLPGLKMGPVGAEGTTAKFDLTLALTESPRGIGGALEYSTDLFERATIERMIGHLARVLEQVADNADVHLSAVDLLSADERALVLDDWNRTESEYPRESSVHALFESQAERAPGATAVVFAGGTLTYAELNARANRLAHHLRALGVGAEARVALVMPRSPELVAAELAVLKAGGVYVPLDPEHPAERLREVLADSAPVALLTTRALADHFADVSMPVLALDDDAPAWASASATNLAADGATAGQLAYVMYTSGSTGRPKGVMVPHRAIVRLVVNNGYAAFGAEDRVAFAANPAFDATTMEVWAPLLNGGALVIIDQDTLLDPARFATALCEHQVSVLWLTVGLFNQYADALQDEWGRLRYLIVGGDALDPRVISRVLSHNPPAHLLNGYGPTETTTFAVTHEIRHVEDGARSIPLGRPIGNTRVYILDRAGQPVPIGVAGELCIGGDGVARGYQARPEQTAERFIPDTFGEPGARMYRTGDLARWKADGTIEFLGRTDHQVKVRGFRIELGEIEARLVEHPSVREAVVLVREDVPGEKRLVAYVVGNESVGADVLRAYLGDRLPSYMVPAAYVRLEQLPLTPNGKVDRRALPAPELESGEERYVAPRNPLEEVIAEVWAEVLRVDRVGAHDGFFELGGHSLLAVRMVSRIREVLGAEVPLRALFEGPTVAELAQRVEDIRRAEPSRLPPVVPVPRDGALPLSLAQERLWFLDRMEPGSTVYNVPLALRLRGALGVDALERALGEIVHRHEALRTVFAGADGSPAQVIHPFAGFTLPVEDVPGEAEARRRVGEEAARPFDLAAGPLFRASLLRLDAGDHVLLLSLHHVVTDGWSMGILLRELSALYGAFREGQASPLAPLPVQYGDYAVWQRAQLAGDALERELAWWKARLAGAPTLLELPTDHPRPAMQSFRGAAESVAVPAALVERLRALGHAEGATLYMVVLAAFQALLGWYAGSDDVPVGTVVSGRARGETEGVIGFFVNTLVLRGDLSGDPAFREVLRRVRETALGAWEHQEVPFERVVAAVQPQRSLSHSPLFQVSFTLDDAAPAQGGFAGLQTEPVGNGVATSKFDLTLGLTAGDDGLRGALFYCADLFEPATIRRMGTHLLQLLERVAGDPDGRLSGLELLGADERRQVLDDWNRHAPIHPPAACIHHLVEAQVERTPHAPALLFGDGALTYAELNTRANRLAHHLSRRGAGPDARVGVCLERGPELVVALLAVLKAGAAYVPLDPTYPAERLALMVADAGVVALVTQESLRGLLQAPPAAAVVTVDGAAAAIGREDGDDPYVDVAPGNLAYLIYTSGSTGVPKGVAIEHANAVALLAWAWDVYSDGELSGVLASTSVCFDLSIFELFTPLTRGGRVILAENALALPTLPAAGAVRLVNTVPSAITALLAGDGLPAGVRTVNLAGEPLRQDLVEALYARGVERVYDLYGPSEDTTYSTWGLRRAGGQPHIGRPLPNSRGYVLDAAQRLVPGGVPGELYLAGRGVSRGYLGRPGLTAERYLPDPFSPVPGARMYRTGDRARWRAEPGEALPVLRYMGRLDGQVKVRGFRIETGEIETVLRRHPRVDDCAVVARAEADGDRRLVAYVVGAAGAEEVRTHLRRHLPAYMVPGPVVSLDALPLTPNGKVDRRALPAPAGAEPGRRRGAETEMEARVAAVWAEVLGLDEVGVEDNFFDLGGHSLLVVKLQARLEAGLGTAVRVVDLFHHPTVRALAARLAGGAESGAGSVAVDEAGERGGTRQAALDRRLEARRRRGQDA